MSHTPTHSGKGPEGREQRLTEARRRNRTSIIKGVAGSVAVAGAVMIGAHLAEKHNIHLEDPAIMGEDTSVVQHEDALTASEMQPGTNIDQNGRPFIVVPGQGSLPGEEHLLPPDPIQGSQPQGIQE